MQVLLLNLLFPASSCFTEVFYLVLLAVVTTKFPIRFVRRQAEWGAGQQLSMKPGLPMNSYCTWCGNRWGSLSWRRT